MLIGEYIHTLDEKNRVSLPSKFRQLLGKKAILTRGLDNCLFIYESKEWQKIIEKLSEHSLGRADKRSIDRFLLSSAVEIEVDNVGRFLVPENLKVFADLKDKIVFAGVGNRVEVWNEKRWSEYKEKIDKQADMLAEKLGEIGAL